MKLDVNQREGVNMNKRERAQRTPEQYLSLAECARAAPGRPHVASVWRWCRVGILARNGRRIRLRCARAGRRIFVRREWLDHFFELVAQADEEHFQSHATSQDHSDSPQHPEKTRQRLSGPDKAREYLESEGF